MKTVLQSKPLIAMASEGAIYVAGGLLGVGLIPLLADVGRTWDLDGGRSTLLVFATGALTGTLAQLLGHNRHPALVAWGLVARGAGLIGLVHVTDKLPKGANGAPHPLALILTWLIGYLVILRLSELIQTGAQRLLSIPEQRPTRAAPVSPVDSAPERPAAKPAAGKVAAEQPPIAVIKGKAVAQAAGDGGGELE